MFDPPHLIKCIRSNQMKHTFKFENLVASWKDIETFYNKVMNLQVDLHTNSQTSISTKANNFSKMKVKYATQVLSHLIAYSLCTDISYVISCLHEFLLFYCTVLITNSLAYSNVHTGRIRTNMTSADVTTGLISTTE